MDRVGGSIGALLLCGITASIPACGSDDGAEPDGAAGGCDEGGEGYWDPDWAALECEVLGLVNEHRAAGADCGSYGSFGQAAPLAMQAQLREAARLHSQWMGETGTFSHDSPGGPNGETWIERIENAGYTGYSSIAENIAAGAATAQGVVEMWMGSDGHCANIMGASFNEVGIGYADVDGSAYGHYWTMDFGAR
jgi:uncharacterized protein YkwD